MSKYFGKSWWGQQWLNSLSNIDYSNRLPRGSAYARNGSVVSVSVEENAIKAKVLGSRSSPYDVTIIIPPFFEPEIKKLIKAIAAKPVIISRLLNRELDPELLNIAEENGLRIFPRQWSDLKMQCSCPDWAVPCKHLAAVVYKISAEIDNNPFLVFRLHRVDLVAELKKRNIYIQHDDNDAIPLLLDLLQPAPLGQQGKHLKKAVVATTIIYQKLNFSLLTPIEESLVQLLPDAPVFYQNSGNFRIKYAMALHRIVRNAQRVIQGKTALENYDMRIDEVSKKKKKEEPMVISHHTVCNVLLEDNQLVFLIDDKRAGMPPAKFINTLWQLPSSQLQDYQPSIVALRTTLLLGLNLLANGAVVPQIVQCADGRYDIRWLPALLSKEVKLLVDQMQQSLPENLVWVNENTTIAGNAALHLSAAFLQELVHLLAEDKTGDPFLDLFFSDYVNAFKEPGQQALANGIQAWLQRYYLAQGKYRPSIVVKESPGGKFNITINLQERDKPLERHTALKEVLVLKKFDKTRFEILRSLAQLSPFVPELDHYINRKGEQEMELDMIKFAPFLMQAVPAIRLLDIDILLPKSLQHILRPKPSVRIKQKAREGRECMRLDKLLDFDWQVAIGDTVLNEADFIKLLKHSEGLIRYKSKYIYVNQADLEKLHKHFSSSRELSAFEMLRAALSDNYYGAKVSLTDEVKEMIKDLSGQTEIALPRGLNATLRPYQLRGYSWMYRNMQVGFGSLMADDMGLGKTLQVIATLLKYKEENLLKKEKALVVVPTGLLANWQAELEKFAPSLVFKVYHGGGRSIKKGERFDIVLTSYGIARTDADILKKMKWHVVIIDEAQNIKNNDTAQSKAIKSIGAGTFIALSGTPVENRLSELWSIMDFCNRGFLGSLAEFREGFANPIQNQNDIEAANKLKAISAPFLMRRLKSDKSIISDLPDKIEMDCFAYLVKEQASLYEKTLQKALAAIEGIQATDSKSLFVRQGLVLQMILALKQICNHPAQFLKNNVMDATLSGKMELLFDRLESIVSANEKVLVFSQFTEMGRLLERFITDRFGEAPLFYHGGCSIKQRKEMVDSFQHNPADKIFILSLKAAGTGLNLTAANHVIHYDLWWNPAVEAQATDRAYRIGQKSNVMVHRFITKGTFEERINEMIQGKKALANLTVATGESWIGNLSNKELKEMFVLGE